MCLINITYLKLKYIFQMAKLPCGFSYKILEGTILYEYVPVHLLYVTILVRIMVIYINNP